ncbi:glycosyl transferase [Bacillus sp. 7586-K]|uniref:glycosyltransferase family 2 protein n=1 Tax=Metabacillus niabensis TaxID=324854 RepID=UPI000BA53357|nr:glycosyl transferase [Bacillus sp. 7586-K]
MHRSPKVSVIMGIYNCEDTLSESIESIINQTYKDWELIICDDASTDSSYKIACHYAKRYSNKIIVIRNNENIKLAGTLNKCLSIAAGEYIARQDGDDISLINRLEKQVDFLDNNLHYMVVGTGMIPFDDLGENGIRIGKPEPRKEDIPKNRIFMHATIMMRREAYMALNGYRVATRTRRAEDFDLWIRFFAKGYRGYNLQEALYKVREDNSAFARRKFKHYTDLSLLIFLACKTLKLPIKYYLFMLKPLIIGLCPTLIVRNYHRFKDSVINEKSI